MPGANSGPAGQRTRTRRDPAIEAILRSAVDLDHPAVGAQRSPSDVAADFLQATAHLSAEETGALMGVSVPTVKRWRVSGLHMVRGRTLSRMLAYLAEPAGATTGLPDSAIGAGA